MESLTWEVGETVIMIGSGPYGRKTLATVEKVTPTGLVKVYGNTYYPNGRERTSDVWGSTCISKTTPELIQEINDRNLVYKAIRKMNECKNITVEQAKQILDILGE